MQKLCDVDRLSSSHQLLKTSKQFKSIYCVWLFDNLSYIFMRVWGGRYISKCNFHILNWWLNIKCIAYFVFCIVTFGNIPNILNCIRVKLKSRLKSGNACYHSVQNRFSYILLSKNIKIEICRTIILPVVLYRRETCFLTLKKEHRVRVFENRVLRNIYIYI